MLAEHRFVTVLDADEVRRRAADLFTTLGFTCEADGPMLDARRAGAESATGATPAPLPWRVHVAFDRGSVSGAAWFEDARRKAGAEHEQVLLALLRALEEVLVAGRSPAEARAAFDEAWARMESRRTADRQTHDTQRIGCIVLVVMIVIVVTLLRGHAC